MTAEQLNIKIKLDISEIKNGAKKVKQELAGMTDKVKQSLPKIGTESTKAAKSLDKISDASKDVKKSIGDIGREAKDSLSSITAQSGKVASALSSIKTASANTTIGFDSTDAVDSTNEVSSAMEKLKGTIQALIGVDVFSGITKNWGTISGFFKRVTEDGWYSPLYRIKEIIKDVGKMIGSFLTASIKKASKAFSNMKYDMKILFQDIKGTFKNLGIEITRLMKSLALVGSVALLAAAKIGANIANSTKQYREEQSKLTTAFQAAGASAEQASQAYNNLFRFLGDSGKAVEAANHLAKLTTNTQYLSEWTTICQGIYATFGDSLPIEGLTEAANETARTGKVVGVLADALNWAGVSEDNFNAILEKTTSLSEREALIRRTLNGLYNNAAQIYEQNNRRIIEQNEAQARLNATMARVGQQTQVVVTSWINLKNVIMTAIAPAIVYLSAVFSVLIDKIAAAIKWLGSLIGIDFKLDNISGIVSGSGISAGISGATDATDGLTDSLDKATAAAQKLKRTTMGFDELNIVSDPNTASGGGASAGADTGIGDIGNITGLETGSGVLSKIGEQVEDVKSKVEAFFDKWKTQIGIIGGALAALGITGLLGHLGKALGLGEKFLNTMGTIKKLATTAIVITLQYTLVNKFMDNYINGEGFKEYIKGLIVSALGTSILYAIWGPAGLVLGLGVTAVASLKAVFDNGGITNVQSAVVALTGLAAAIGAVAVAWKSLGVGAAVTSAIKFIKDYVAAVKVASSEVGLFAAMFPKLSGAISSTIGSISAFVGSLSTGAILAIAGIIAGIASVVVFLARNWDSVTAAVQNFFKENIVPKLNTIKETLGKLRDALLKVIPEPLVQLLKKIVSAIGDIVKAIADWFKSIGLLEAIGKIFEVVGGIIFGAVTGVIAGAINMFVELINGLVEVVTGIVEVVSGVFEIIIGLFTLNGEKIKSGAQSILQGVIDAFEGLLFRPINAVVEFFKGVINWFTNLWDELVGHSIVPDTINAIIEWFAKLPLKILEPLKTFVQNVIKTVQNMWDSIKSWFSTNVAKFFTKEYWTGKFDTIRSSASEKLEAAKNEISNKWNAIKGWFSSNVVPKFTKDYWMTKFDTIKQGASQKLNEVKTTIQNTWNTVKSWFSSNVAPKFTASYWTTKFNSIKDGAKAAFNGVIDIVERAINSIIRKLNTVSFSIPSWVPGVGGKKFGISLSEVRIPRLATGGIATSSTLANIGERGAEAVLPLTGTQGMAWMDKLAEKIADKNNNNNTPAKIVLQLDGRELGWATIDNINAITKQTGGLKLHIV